jgi:hypothetical protein
MVAGLVTVAMRLKVPMAPNWTDSQGTADIAVGVAEMTRNTQSSRGKDSGKAQ